MTKRGTFDLFENIPWICYGWEEIYVMWYVQRWYSVNGKEKVINTDKKFINFEVVVERKRINLCQEIVISKYN